MSFYDENGRNFLEHVEEILVENGFVGSVNVGFQVIGVDKFSKAVCKNWRVIVFE